MYKDLGEVDNAMRSGLLACSGVVPAGAPQRPQGSARPILRRSGQPALRRTPRRAEGNKLERMTQQGQLKLRTEGIDDLINQPDASAAGRAVDHIPTKHPVHQLFPRHPALIEAMRLAALLACLRRGRL